mmetsp:Transcript_35522/g.113509  ORF Transcript_35522/g.113509 Transcript_35522/m.113509 type:complete len:276 (-) Transcript_35522:149-976(-)|eukprot:CAMPEP_0118917480 /NCGR_PEP_ID=MMETSP1166-20130328/17352_1 /TAXON_ID=1104430 /ORGANISM="Chrysoreinhardia sp, Strain CCMP3193" /LENGTH=275 /DNA_ID=CAMNT_0006857661 /DNA_START=34 /DNA_END=861 /DNA_ORIENTATION=+
MTSGYGGLAQSEEVSAMARQQLVALKRQVLEGSTEFAALGAIGSALMMVLSVLSLLSDVVTLTPVRGLVMIYCFFGGAALLTFEGIHRHTVFTKVRAYLLQEMHCLATLSGRAFAYAFFGSLMLTDSAGWLGRAVGLYLVLIACAMLYVARRAGNELLKAGAGLSPTQLEERFNAYDKDNDGRLERAELAALCHDLGTHLTARELETALNLLDADHTGFVDKAEFINWWHGDNWQRSLLAASSTPSNSSTAAKEDLLAEHGGDTAGSLSPDIQMT